MRHGLVLSSLILLAAAAMNVPERGLAQNPADQLPLPPGGFKPPPMAPIKPYKAVAVTPPAPFNDPGFVAFRKQLADAVRNKNRAALGKLVVAHGFFWVQDKDLADKRKSGMSNLAKAVDLDAKDGSGWDVLESYAESTTAEPLPDHPGVICAPANPKIDPKAFEALLAATRTQPAEWGYPFAPGLEVRSAARPDAPVTERLGLTLVRVLPDTAPPSGPNQPVFLHIATPSGKAGYVSGDSLASFGGDQMCFIKEAAGWKIVGYFGGAGE